MTNPIYLTRRQQQVRDMIVRGLSTKQIARELGIAPSTVEDHRKSLYAAMGVKSAVELAVKVTKAEMANG